MKKPRVGDVWKDKGDWFHFVITKVHEDGSWDYRMIYYKTSYDLSVKKGFKIHPVILSGYTYIRNDLAKEQFDKDLEEIINET